MYSTRNRFASRFTNKPRFGGSRGFNGRSRFAGRGRGMPSVPVDVFIRKASLIKPSGPAPVPTMPVSSLAVSDILKRNIESRGYKLLMPIQEQAIPAILDGKDVIGIANTGTGKTAAFLIPMVEKIIKNPQYRAIIITPTRELALQIQDELRKITQGLRVYSTFCIGQSSMRNQIMELRRNPHVVIGTPGRLKDLIERKNLNLTRFSMFVLDEVDQMLDMGFARDVKHIISFLPATRQSLFFSATVSPEINTLIQSFVKNPITVSVKRQETVSPIKQETVKVREGASKIEVLNGLLRKEGFRKVLVFGRTKHGVERLGRNLFEKGFRVSSIHGDKPQVKRQQAIRMFKEDAISILVATDVAARGLDIDNVTHVINYDAPATYEDYIHRIGRTGRANKQGVALTFV